MKIKEGEKIDKYLDLERALKMLGNMRVTEILVIIGTLRTVTKGLESGPKRIENHWKNRYRPD